VWSTLKIAREQGWGNTEDPEQLLAKVMDDYEYVNGWYSDKWHWAAACVTMLDEQGEQTEHCDSNGGFEWGYGDYEATAFELITELVYNVLYGATSHHWKQHTLFNDLEVNEQTLTQLA
jgi:hypothetical protein